MAKLQAHEVRLELAHQSARTSSEVTDRINATRKDKVQEGEVIDVISWCVRLGSVREFEHNNTTFYFLT